MTWRAKEDKNLKSFCKMHGFAHGFDIGIDRISNLKAFQEPKKKRVILQIRGRIFSSFYRHYVYDVKILQHPTPGIVGKKAECSLDNIYAILTENQPMLIKDGWGHMVLDGPAIGEIKISIS